MIFEPDSEEDKEKQLPDIQQPLDMRPDLSELGLEEHEKGVVVDSYENRAALRQANFNWDYVYDQLGNPTGLIVARSKEAQKNRRIMSLGEKRPLLEDPTKNNSDYLTGLDLLIEEAACKVTPPWVLGATRKYVDEINKGGPNPGRKPASLPHRCRFVKQDGIRCLLWSSGLVTDDGLCRIHLQNNKRRAGADIEKARQKLLQSAPYAVDVLEELMETAQGEPTRLRAATEILDRAGVRGGMELDVSVDATVRTPSEIINERLQRLASAAIQTAIELPNAQIADAELITETTDNEENQA
jgi:hypothetical protein